MIIFLLLLLVICIINIRFAKRSEYFSDSLDKSSTQSTCIKGLFAFIIVLSHARSYLSLDHSWYNHPYVFLLDLLGQLIVVMFLFYSGYGIMESYKRNNNYFKSYPYTRIFKVLLHFDLAIILFIIVDAILGISYAPSTIALSFIGWESIGNSNWFVFSILVGYIVIYLAHFISKKPLNIAIITTILLLMFCIGLSFAKQSWWYNTILTMPLGMFYAIFKDKLHACIFKNTKNYILYLCILIVPFIIMSPFVHYFDDFGILNNLYSCMFALLVIAITYKIKVTNKVLVFLGKHSFSIYITQRLFMIVLARTDLVNYPISFTLICFIITIIIGYLFTCLCNAIDKVLFKKKSQCVKPN